jgi:hypothetical protein
LISAIDLIMEKTSNREFRNYGIQELQIRKRMEKAPGGAHALSMSRIPPGAKKRLARLFVASRAKAESWK